MLQELACANRVVGAKQSKKMILAGKAEKVFLARDCDPKIQDVFRSLCRDGGIALSDGYTLSQLGQFCGIKVGAAVVTLMK